MDHIDYITAFLNDAIERLGIIIKQPLVIIDRQELIRDLIKDVNQLLHND